jgi:hypothetical protein
VQLLGPFKDTLPVRAGKCFHGSKQIAEQTPSHVQLCLQQEFSTVPARGFAGVLPAFYLKRAGPSASNSG